MFIEGKRRFAAPAKVNLTLRVVGKREDGYHELQSWMQKISLYDWIDIELTENPGIVLSCTSEEVPKDCRNIIYKAAELFFAKCVSAEVHGAIINLEKNIPVAAGLGGGSSDAGTVLKGLNLMNECPLTKEELARMALELGADVPFFVSDYSSIIAEGIGEKMSPVPDLDDVTYVLVNPGIAVSTKWVYDNFLLTDQIGKCNLPRFIGSSAKENDGIFLQNDLEKVTEVKYPIIREIKDSLLGFGASGVLMSGSGPTVFGIFSDSDKKSCKAIEDAVKTMRLRFRNKAYKARASVGV